MLSFKSYKPAAFYKGPKYSYIFYFYKNPLTSKFHRFKEYFDLNRIQNETEQKMYANEIIKFINHKLKGGFNPFNAKRLSAQQDHLSFIFKKLITDLSYNRSKHTRNTYATMRNRFEQFLCEEKLENMRLVDFDMNYCEAYKQYMIDKKLSKKTINGTLTHMALFWETAVAKKIVLDNPFRKITRIKNELHTRDDKDIFEPLTSHEMKIIFEKIKTKDKHYITFLAFIFYAWIRPIEITRLKISDIDLDQNFIRLKKNITKNNKNSFVQLVPPLKEILLNHLQGYSNQDDYIFSENFLPGKIPIGCRWPYKMWLRYVVKDLGINKNLYALKHTGNIDYLINNKGSADLKWQQMQNRHGSSGMTEQYNRKLGAYFIDTDKIKFSIL